ncbi:MAG: transposase [Chlamydiia bacterium]|nr:transposase [Chlamydiia bacterium]
MPWNEVKVVDQRKEFISQVLNKNFSFAQLCRQFEISRKTGYKWVKRFHDNGLYGLDNQPRAPHIRPRSVSDEVVDLVLGIKKRWTTWGQKKVHAYLKNNYLDIQHPSVTTVENILKRNGLVLSRKFRRRLAERTEPLFHCQGVNELWCTDFKGWGLTSDRHKCGPFTLMDAHSRYLFACNRLNMDDTDHVWAVLDKSFREYGLPLRIRSDNGPPFASSAPGRLSKMAIKLIKAGVIPEWTEPGHPEQNGRQERMHRTLQDEGIFGDLTLAEQVKKLDEFIEYYNFTRPHEAIDQKTPGAVHVVSPREWTGRFKSPEYPDEYKVCKVGSCGKMSWQGRGIYISRVFEGEPVGICERDEGLVVFYGPIELGVIGDNSLRVARRAARKRVPKGRSHLS